jgi:DNA-binding CsgD family transcriptional regulator/pimeloyl-ACP methyl ester carboxylesterase
VICGSSVRPQPARTPRWLPAVRYYSRVDTQAVRYVSTRDGVSIAFAVSGSGPALVHMPNLGVSSLLLERAMPERRRWELALEQRFTVVRYDARGHGLSQRAVADLTAPAHHLDLEAVMERAGVGRMILLGFLGTAFIAPVYAAAHPEQVSHLILWPPDTRDRSAEEYRGLANMAVSDWETFTETYAHLALGWDLGEAAHRYATVMRESITQETFLRSSVASSFTSLVNDHAPKVHTPTLIVQRRMRYAADRVARLAAAFPVGQLTLFDGEQTLPYLGNVREVVDAIVAFTTTARSTAGAASHGDVRPAGLTERELGVVRLVSRGLTNQEIADELVLSVRTVERHLANIYAKIGGSGKAARAAAAAFAVTNGIG